MSSVDLRVSDPIGAGQEIEVTASIRLFDVFDK
jgi:hypothetical protein